MTIAPPPAPKALPPKPAGKPSLPKASPAPKTAARAPKTFVSAAWSGHGEGEKIVLYGASGMGKTTLASMAPRPVFIGVDDGARKIRDPRDDSVLNAIMGVETFDDVREAIHQKNLYDDYETLVIDTITKVEELSEPYIFEHYKVDGKTVHTLEGYGWGKGYRHALEVMRLILQDCGALVKLGKNVILIAQENAVKMPNAEGLDYIQAGPKLFHTSQASSRLEVQEWADHVLRIGYAETNVAGAGAAATKGKITSRSTTRHIFTKEARHFFAKSRTIREPVISFSTNEEGVPNDDALWQFLFPNQETK